MGERTAADRKRRGGDFFARLASWFLRLVFVPKCQICSSVLDPSSSELCPKCLGAWEAARRSRCPVCRKTAPMCTCRPIHLTETDMLGERIMSSLAFYGKYGSEDERDIAVLKTVYAVKTSQDRQGVKFAARQMAADILRLISAEGEDIEKWRFTYPPRKAARRRHFGFDQGADLCRELTRYTGIPTERCFAAHGGTTQKSLNSAERRDNAMGSYKLRRDADPNGKKYFIVDDIITTGATVSACAKLLRSAGAKCIFPVCIARTKRKKLPAKRRRPKDSPWFTARPKKA